MHDVFKKKKIKPMVKIMVVDDELFVRTRMKNFLERSGFTVILAENGNQAYRYYERERPDVVFCDIMMPGMDGLQALRKIREIDPDANVVMISEMGGQQATMVQALSAGARDIIPKPYKEDKVLELIKKYTEKESAE